MYFNDNIMSIKSATIKIYRLFFLVFCLQGFCQQAQPFKIRHQGYVKGDMVIIANNSVNKEEKRSSTSLPYNERKYTSQLNDECKMNYIDIDNDPTTFSSSSADLSMENQSSKKIVYAGLYWSATYLYESGKMSRQKKFKAIDNKRNSFDRIKIKLPNQENYSDVTGELIFDGINNEAFKESAPYVMYADITNMVKNNANAFGTYTIANIKATTGMISGGVSAGWSIFFVYEDLSMTGKFITTYDGFAAITDQSLDIEFSGFQTLPDGKVNAKIACMALEGDLKLKGDQLLFKTPSITSFIQLSNLLREKNNFFNSAITTENEFFQNRVPNSLNTLGYDSFVMSIDNPDNTVIGNNTHDATIRLKTVGDRFCMFFNAFNVEVVVPKHLQEQEASQLIVEKTLDIQDVAKNDASTVTIKETKDEVKSITKPNKSKVYSKVKKSKRVIAEAKKPIPIIKKNSTNKISEVSKVADIEPTKQEESKNTIIATNTTTVFENKKENTTKTAHENHLVRKQAIESQSRMIPSNPQGYYIIANVFANPNNATRFISSLRKKGIVADFFINPENNYRYVYLSMHNDFQEASSVYQSNVNGKYYGDLWIMTVNKQENENIAYKKQEKPNQKMLFIEKRKEFYYSHLYEKNKQLA